jgi:hypothetical protein
LKLIGYIAWDVELAKSHYVHVTTTAAMTTISTATTTKAKGTKMNNSGSVEGEVDLNITRYMHAD